MGMAERSTRSWLRSLLWILATLLLWPVWFWLVQIVVTFPVTWAVSLAPEPAAESSASAGLYSFVEIGVLAVAGLVFGFLGVYLLRRLGAPRIVWVPAAVVSVSAYVAVATFWVSFSEGGRGWAANTTESVAASAGLGLTMAVGAWLAARDWRSAAGRGRERRRGHTADEFGRSPATGGMVGFDPPLIGAASVIALDGLVERESGATPPPPPFSLKAAAIGLGVMFALGGVALVLVRCFAPNVAGR